MYFSRTLACLTNATDSPMVYTNGIYLADLTNDTMGNGSGLNPSIYTNQTYGLYTTNSHILLPWPEAPDSIALFHMATDAVNQSSTFISAQLYLSVIDMDQNTGFGAVVNKNQVLDIGEFCTGGVSACKHGNGRDWWVFFHRCTSDEFVKFLLTPSGVEGPFYQAIGGERIGSVPSGVFTMDGEHFAYLDAFSDLDVFDFDRCTGELSGLRHVDIDSSQYAAFAAYSPSGRFVYATWVDRIYQYDTYAIDLEASRVTVAVWDSTYDPSPPFAQLFMNICLAPDGRIYVSTGNSSRFMHVIDQPDSLGMACNVLLHAHHRQTYTDNSIPYRPNYQLGPLAGSTCDTLGLGMTERPSPPGMSVWPNPNDGAFILRYPAQKTLGIMEVYDLNGQSIFVDHLPAGSTSNEPHLANVPAGIYHIRVRWQERVLNTRVIVQNQHRNP